MRKDAPEQLQLRHDAIIEKVMAVLEDEPDASVSLAALSNIVGMMIESCEQQHGIERAVAAFQAHLLHVNAHIEIHKLNLAATEHNGPIC